MTGRDTDLLHLEKHGVLITVHIDLFNLLDVTGGSPFVPEFLAGSAPVVGFPGLKGLLPGAFIDLG